MKNIDEKILMAEEEIKQLQNKRKKLISQQKQEERKKRDKRIYEKGAVFANAVSGKSGISITVGLKYTRTYLHKDGYYVYGWSPTSLSVRRY